MKPDDIARIGCICCHIDGRGYVPAELHHVRICGGKREKADILPLCPSHHRLGRDSLHMSKSTFRARYGNEYFLLSLVAKMITEMKRNTIGGR